jgi:hypothetical protein
MYDYTSLPHKKRHEGEGILRVKVLDFQETKHKCFECATVK